MEPVKNSQELDVRSPKALEQQCKKTRNFGTEHSYAQKNYN